MSLAATIASSPAGPGAGPRSGPSAESVPGEASGSWILRRPFADAESRRSGASWLAAAAGHAGLAALGLLIAFEAPLPPLPPQPDAMNVEIVLAVPGPRAASETAEREDAPDAPSAAAAEPRPERFADIAVPARIWPDVLRQYEEARRAQEARGVPPGVSGRVRAALSTAWYCRSTAAGIAADIRRCPPALDRFALERRVAQVDPRTFIDPEMVEPEAPEPPRRLGGTGVVVRATTVRTPESIRDADPEPPLRPEE